MELYNRDGVSIAKNDNWRTGGQETEIIATTIPPTHDIDSAIVATPAADSTFTAIVRGANNMMGVARVEVYSLD